MTSKTAFWHLPMVIKYNFGKRGKEKMGEKTQSSRSNS
jgi:hypothetical protein